jgi:hypothetical protein
MHSDVSQKIATERAVGEFLMGRDHLVDQDKYQDNIKLDTSGSGQGPVAGSCKHGNEPSSSIKGREFLDLLNNYQLLEEVCTHEMHPNTLTGDTNWTATDGASWNGVRAVIRHTPMEWCTLVFRSTIHRIF